MIALLVTPLLQSMDDSLTWKDDKNRGFSPSDKALCYIAKQLPISNLIVLDYDFAPGMACKFAQKAQLVHSDRTGLSDSELEPIRQQYIRVPKLVLTDPQEETYDCATLYSPGCVTVKHLPKSLLRISKFLKPSGIVYGIVQIKEDDFFPDRKAFEEVYPLMYESIPRKMQEILGSKFNPSQRNIKQKLPSFLQVREFCEQTGYEIITYQNNTYNVIIKDQNKYEEQLKFFFNEAIQNLSILEEDAQRLTETFVNLTLMKLQRNNKGYLIYPFVANEIELKKRKPILQLNTGSLLAFTQKTQSSSFVESKNYSESESQSREQ